MVKLSVENIGQDVIDFNIAKAGHTAYYVDGTNGLDTYPGDSWGQPFKTIQHAVDTADSWTDIFIRSATYVENVVMPAGKDSVNLFGEKESGVIVMPATGNGINIAGDKCGVYDLTAIGNGDNDAGIFFSNLSQVNSNAARLIVGNKATHGRGLTSYGEYAVIDQIRCNQTYKPETSIYIYTGKNTVIKNCYLDVLTDGITIVSSELSKVFNNTILNASNDGCHTWSGSQNAIYHNNFINNTRQIHDDESPMLIYENFYDDHTNIDNGFGIATEPFIKDYTIYKVNDPRPVVCRDGWLWLSWADADLVGLIKTETDKLAGGEYTGTVSAGTSSETTLKEIITTSRMEIKSIWLDLVNLVADGATIKLYHKVDGTNYRVFEIDSWSLTDDDGVLIHGFTINNDFKITITGGESAGVDIPYNIIYQTMEG